MGDFLKSIGLRGYVDTYLGISFHDVQGNCNCSQLWQPKMAKRKCGWLGASSEFLNKETNLRRNPKQKRHKINTINCTTKNVRGGFPKIKAIICLYNSFNSSGTFSTEISPPISTLIPALVQMEKKTCPNKTGWWLNHQPLWKICSSKWVRLPQFSGWK